MLRRYLFECGFQMPERSGWPSFVRGAGAVRSGSPFAFSGIVLRTFSHHCA